MSVQQEFQKIIADALKETGLQLKVDAREYALYLDGRAAHLATLVGQPGFDMAVIAERDSAILKAGILAVGQADAVQSRFIGIIQGALSMAARLLTGV